MTVFQTSLSKNNDWKKIVSKQLFDLPYFKTLNNSY